MSGSYIVIFKKDATNDQIDALMATVPNVKHRYNIGDFRGFAAELTDQQLASVLNSPLVDYFEPDGPVTAFAQAQQKLKH